MTYSNVTAERRSLIDLSLRPLMTCITQRLSDNDITPRGSIVKYNLEEFYSAQAHKNAQTYTQNLFL
jgi:hypothetical protein